jgi:hypothetical protein
MGMVRADQEQELLRTLSASLSEHAGGFTAEAAGGAGVVVLNKGHYRGVWHWTDGSYSFTPGGYAHSTHSADTAQDAVSFTLNRVCRR